MDQKKAIEDFNIPCKYDVEMAKTCRRLVERYQGKYQSEPQKGFLLVNAKKGKGLISDKKFRQYINKILLPLDRAIIYRRLHSRTKEYQYYIFFILDETGVRVAVTATGYWKKVKMAPKPFSKENWHDTTERRRSQNTGLNESDMEYRYKGEIIFKRSGVDTPQPLSKED